MYDVIREVIFYAFFLWVLMVVSYGFRDPNAFFLKKNLHFHFVDAGLSNIRTSTAHTDLSKVSLIKLFVTILPRCIVQLQCLDTIYFFN